MCPDNFLEAELNILVLPTLLISFRIETWYVLYMVPFENENVTNHDTYCSVTYRHVELHAMWDILSCDVTTRRAFYHVNILFWVVAASPLVMTNAYSSTSYLF